MLYNGLQEVKRPSTGQKFSRAVGAGLDEMRKQQEDEAIKKQFGIDVRGMSPEFKRQIVSDQLRYGRQRQQAKATQEVSLSPQGNESSESPQIPQRETPEDRQQFARENKPQPREKGPNFAGMQQREEQPAFSHAPQPETKGKKRPVLDPDQTIKNGERIAKEYNDRGIPTTVQEGIGIAQKINKMNQDYNKEVEADIEQQVKSQQAYGNRGKAALLKVHNEATPEQEALFARKGEEYSKANVSEAEIDKKLAKDAVQFKNTISNVKKSIPAPRLLEKIKRNVLGTDRSDQQSRNDINIKLQPLLKEGLYDTSRNILSQLGYHPEERESIIADLGENTKKIMSSLPKFQKSIEGEGTGVGPYGGMPLGEHWTEQDREKMKSSLGDILKSDPSTNLILLRKAFEDKNVDWRTFKDDLNEMIYNGEIELNPDQVQHLDLLDNPPLDNLDKILYGIKLIGR